MALLFDQNQGSFQDTGSQRSPTKKNTGIMRKEMSKLDEVAPRGHTLAYITPEEAQMLNRGGGGIDDQGNQMIGPYGVSMYPGYGKFVYQGAGKASGGDQGGSTSKNTSSSNDRSTSNNNRQQKQKQERPKDMPAMLSYEPPKKNFNTDNFMETVGNSIGGNKETINQGLLIDPGLQASLDRKEKGDGILERKGDVSNKIIEHLKANTPKNEKEQNELLFVADKLPPSIKNKIKKSVDDGEISLLADTKLPNTPPPSMSVNQNVQKLSTGDMILSDVDKKFPNIPPPSITAKEDMKKNLVHAPSKLLDRPLGMPAHLTYSTGVGDTKLSNAQAKIYNDAKDNFIADYSDLFNKDTYEGTISKAKAYHNVANQIGLSNWEQFKTAIDTIGGGIPGEAFWTETFGQGKEGRMQKKIYDILGDRFNSDFSWDAHYNVRQIREVFPLKPWIEMQIKESGSGYLGERSKRGQNSYIEKDGKIIPVVRSFKDDNKAMYIDDFGRIREYIPPKGTLRQLEGLNYAEEQIEDVVASGEAKIPFINKAFSTDEQSFTKTYEHKLQLLNSEKQRPYQAVQPVIKEIMENNPEKYGDINEAWSSKGGYADASKNFIGGFEYGFFGSQYENEYINLAILYQRGDFENAVKKDNKRGMDDALPDALDNIAGIKLGAEYAKKGLALPSIEELAQLGLEYADVVKRPILTDNSLMNP